MQTEFELSANRNQPVVSSGILIGTLVGACLVIILYAAQSNGWAQFYSIVGVSIGLAAAAALIGGLLGFLFGIPRMLQPDAVAEPATNSHVIRLRTEGVEKNPYKPSTNLEEISDWLTKILVGVGLTQVGDLKEIATAYMGSASEGLGNFPGCRPFSLALAITFLVVGFLVSFLTTRLKLPKAYYEADFVDKKSFEKLESDFDGRLDQVRKSVSELERQAAADAKALLMVQQQLNPGQDA